MQDSYSLHCLIPAMRPNPNLVEGEITEYLPHLRVPLPLCSQEQRGFILEIILHIWRQKLPLHTLKPRQIKTSVYVENFANDRTPVKMHVSKINKWPNISVILVGIKLNR